MDIKFINDHTYIACCSNRSIIVSDILNKVCQLRIPNVHISSIN